VEAPASTQPAGIHDIQLELVELIGAHFFSSGLTSVCGTPLPFAALQRHISYRATS